MQIQQIIFFKISSFYRKLLVGCMPKKYKFIFNEKKYVSAAFNIFYAVEIFCYLNSSKEASFNYIIILPIVILDPILYLFR